ncbi:DUF2834 domain-containing protein [Persicobacter psychrovividus]|uniref:DUF2834 domain-containing protein n=1 Tax=Persicobacter psychrovividus TaxID=387638 RepID=A0ABN6LCH1_9BACT|nr:hypothetical protein PEPS_13670 [Persicobacter psychrovividus]
MAKHTFLIFAVFGLVIPFESLIRFFMDKGFDIGLLFMEVFEQPSSTYFAWDSIISAMACLAFVILEGRRKDMKNLWAPMLACFIVGASFALPLFLYMREVKIETEFT